MSGCQELPARKRKKRKKINGDALHDPFAASVVCNPEVGQRETVKVIFNEKILQ